MKKSHVLILGVSIVLALAGCKEQSDATATPKAAAPAVVPAPKPDVLKKEQVAIAIELESAPRLAADAGSLEIPVKITNNGTSALSSKLRPPVNIGLQIMGTEGNLDSEGAVRDFVRTPLPVVEPGASVSVIVKVPANGRIDGHKMKIGLVQESVTWFRNWDQPELDVGPYTLCNTSICDADGKPL